MGGSPTRSPRGRTLDDTAQRSSIAEVTSSADGLCWVRYARAGDISEAGAVAGQGAARRCQHGRSWPGILHNGAVDHAEAALLAGYPDLEPGRDLAPATAIWPTNRFRLRHGTVTALNPILAATLSRTTTLPPDARLLTASPDLRLVVAAAGGSLIVLGETQWRLAVPGGADSAAILGSGQLWVTARVTGPGVRPRAPTACCCSIRRPGRLSMRCSWPSTTPTSA